MLSQTNALSLGIFVGLAICSLQMRILGFPFYEHKKTIRVQVAFWVLWLGGIFLTCRVILYFLLKV